MIDLGIRGRKALVCGSSSGLGLACAMALSRAGVSVTLNSRTEETLARAAAEIERETGTLPPFIVADVTSEPGRQSVLSQCGDIDILINNAAGPKPGDFRDFDAADWHEAASVSMISPILMIKSVLEGMIQRRWGRIINITSSAVKAPLPLLHLSNGARSGLTGFVAGLAREVAIYGVTINNLLPGRFDTTRLQSYIRSLAAKEKSTIEAVTARLVASNPAGRFGRPNEFGAFCAFLASESAAYMTGQNILLDGGEYPGL